MRRLSLWLLLFAAFIPALPQAQEKRYENPASDPFHYSGPDDWRSERHAFPLPWAPSIPFHGLADLLFAPGFADPKSPNFFSYIGLWWIEGHPHINDMELQRLLLVYYRGLSADFAQQGKFTADPERVTVTLKADRDGVMHGDITTYGFRGPLITLHTDVVIRACKESEHSVIFFMLTPQERGQPIWAQMKTIGDSFRCQR